MCDDEAVTTRSSRFGGRDGEDGHLITLRGLSVVIRRGGEQSIAEPVIFSGLSLSLSLILVLD